MLAVNAPPIRWPQNVYVVQNHERLPCHKEDYRLFVPRELAPDLTVLTGQIMRHREDKGSSLRFEARAAHGQRQGLDAQSANERLLKSLEQGREVLAAAKAKPAF
jgi:hypothetical protein